MSLFMSEVTTHNRAHNRPFKRRYHVYREKVCVLVSVNMLHVVSLYDRSYYRLSLFLVTSYYPGFKIGHTGSSLSFGGSMRLLMKLTGGLNLLDIRALASIYNRGGARSAVD